MGFNGYLSLPDRWIYREIYRLTHVGVLQKDERKHTWVAGRENLNKQNKFFSIKVFKHWN